jgi:uncharacterized RDD family membrane protein YckC
LSDYGTTPPPPPPPPPPSPAGGFQQPGYGAAPSGAPLASWGPRVGAYLIDYLITVPGAVIAFIGMPKVTSTDINGSVSSSSSEGTPILILVGLVLLIAAAIYNRWIMGGKGASLGKKVLGLQLTSERTGQPIGTGQAFVRDVLHVLDSVLYIGYLFPLWDPKKQTFSDKILGTLVIKA